MNAVFIISILIVLASVTIGGLRGFLKSCLALVSMILAAILLSQINTSVVDFMKDHTGADTWIGTRVDQILNDRLEDLMGSDENVTLSEDYVLPEDYTLPDGTVLPAGTTLPAGTVLSAEAVSDNLTPAQQTKIIDELPLPKTIRNTLKANNNQAIYAMLGVEDFFDYIRCYVTNVCLSLLAYAALFILILLAVHALSLLIAMIDKLPVIHEINHLAGALLGVVKGLLIIEVLLLVLIPFATTTNGMAILAQVRSNVIMNFLYEKNIFLPVILNFAKALI